MENEKVVEEGLENQPKPNATAVDKLETLEPSAEQKVAEPTKAGAKRPADNDNADPAPAPLKDSIEIDDAEEVAKLQEQEVPKVELSEDIASLLEAIELPEEFKSKALTIFEAAVAGQVSDLHKKMLAENEQKVAEYKQSLETKLNEKVDAYLTESVAKWVEENQVAVKSNLRTQIAESFMTQLVALLETHYISVPEGKEDILEASLEKVSKLEEEVDRLVKENTSQKESIDSLAKKSVFEASVASLTDTQKERVATLAESIKDVDVDAYKEKLSTIIESLTTKESVKPSQFVTEDVEGDANPVVEEKSVEADKPSAYSYIAELAKQASTI